MAALYELLVAVRPGPVVELNRAVAVAMVEGPERGLALLDDLEARGALRTTTSCTRPGRISCAGWDGARRRPRRTGARGARWPTRWSARFLERRLAELASA